MITQKAAYKITLVILTLLVTSCKNEPFSIEEEQNKILAQHNAQRVYHFEKDSIAFANQLSDNFISVNRGVISKPEKEATISRYHGYFSSVKFIKWDDVTPPIIKFSDDGSLAYTIVDKIVTVSYEDKDGNIKTGETHFAWTAIYKKYGDDWKVEAVTSTNK
ncbi:nuclear transport factor 2 family protein [Flavobacteriaceae bacterium S356]|uniref:Nuclear transport factor 2 family protein n=1 Tax=Asprobacillus argus TaxID=3076534 RepID=A0ABU3LDQ1_9FLAO|nr:nuclear transport factor 2 family protein [Flavobacteriaceae bacterium S356]